MDNVVITTLLIVLALVCFGGSGLMFGDMARLAMLGDYIPLWRVVALIGMFFIGVVAVAFIPGMIASLR